MNHPCRCNKCRARRSLRRHPFDYKREPKCHFKNCTGVMVLDEYRFNKGAKDHPPVCYSDCYMYPHRVDSPHCKQRIEWVLDRAFQ